MIIDIEKLGALVAEGDKIFLEPEGEKVILQLEEIKKQVELAEQAIKIKLEETALRISPDFKSIQGDNIKVHYRYFGSRFYIDPHQEDRVPAELIDIIQKKVLNMKAVETYIEEKGGLPVGVAEADRKKQISFSFKGEGGENGAS